MIQRYNKQTNKKYEYTIGRYKTFAKREKSKLKFKNQENIIETLNKRNEEEEKNKNYT